MKSAVKLTALAFAFPVMASDVVHQAAPITNFVVIENWLDTKTFSDDSLLFNGSLITNSTKIMIPFVTGYERMWFVKPSFNFVLQDNLGTSAFGSQSEDGSDIQMLDHTLEGGYGYAGVNGDLLLVGGAVSFPTTNWETNGIDMSHDQFRAGPGISVVKNFDWGSLSTDLLHMKDISGEGADYNMTILNYGYDIRLPQSGWSLHSFTTASYDWEKKKMNVDALELPVGVGLSKAVNMGSTLMKISGEFQYNVAKTPASSDWSFRFKVMPLVKK